MVAPKNTFDIIFIVQKAGQLSVIYAVIKYSSWPPCIIPLPILTYLFTYLFGNFGCVKNFATHHTDFTLFISFFCIHDIVIILGMSIAMVAERYANFLYQLAGLWMT